MAHTYILFDFGADEAKAQQARHKLEGWKQAFRLDKKLQFKFERDERPAPEAVEKTGKPQPKSKAKPKAEASGVASEQNGNVKLLVRLYFSAHEKLSEQRWIERIPSEEPFKGAAPKVVQEGEEEFSDVLAQFDSLD
jgi:hypothetical protein